MSIIGICGKGGSGKDSIANYLIQKYEYARVAAADAMKVDLCKYLDMDLTTLESYKNINLYLTDIAGNGIGNFSIRRFLQLYGMDMRYRIKDTYWLERSIKMKTDELQNTGQSKIVVSDVRFEIEYDWIEEQNGIMIYVEGRTGLTKNESEHISEQFVNTTAKSACDHIIDNSLDFTHLYKQVDKVMNEKNIRRSSPAQVTNKS